MRPENENNALSSAIRNASMVHERNTASGINGLVRVTVMYEAGEIAQVEIEDIVTDDLSSVRLSKNMTPTDALHRASEFLKANHAINVSERTWGTLRVILAYDSGHTRIERMRKITEKPKKNVRR